jgi:methionyl-tRNA synthetase
MPRKGFYITTAIDYLNGSPHVGHAYEKIGADIMARFHRLRGEEVFFVTGSDENAPKVAAAAQTHGKTPQEWVDELAARFRQAWEELEISYDVYIRTTEPRHREAVQTLFRTLRDRGDIYMGLYEGWYCQTDEAFFALEETLEGRDAAGSAIRLCPTEGCGRPLELTQEENYFFALSRYTDRLLAHYEAHPEFVEPEFRRNEVVQFIRQGLRDMTISRKAAGWGIPVPDDESQVLYIWFDALINYITACGYPHDGSGVRGQGSGEAPESSPDLTPDPRPLAPDPHWWPADWHLVGKDILVRFHATLWPAMLMGAGLPLPRQIFGHGHLTIEGERMSKTRGNVLDPVQVARELAERSGATMKVAVDAVRYHLYREMPHGADGDVALAGLYTRYNADLANDLGNALNRALTMVARNFEGRVPPPVEAPASPSGEGIDLPRLAAEVVREAESAYAEFRLQQTLLAAWRLVSGINKYIGEQAPWELARRGETAAQGSVLYHALEGARVASVLLAPVMPTVAAEMQRQLGVGPEGATWASLDRWGGLRAGAPVGEPAPIFPRIDLKKAGAGSQTAGSSQAKRVVTEPAAAAPSGPNTEHPGTREAGDPNTITIDDFAKLDLRVAEVLSAERVAGADKLLQLRVNLGTEERTVLAGVALAYAPETLVGRKIVIIANLAPRKIRGVVSHGMILAADAGEESGGVAILSPDKDVPPGSRVR